MDKIFGKKIEHFKYSAAHHGPASVGTEVVV
jgi:hypothetical protein